MKYFQLIIPVFLIFLVVYCAVKRVKPYDAFAEGAAKAIPLVKTIFPYLATMLILAEIFEKSGLSEIIVNFISPATNLIGIPSEILPLVMIKPFSGSGSLAVLGGIYEKYGADGYIARCASAVFGSSETIFYISSVYFAKVKEKRLIKPIIISLISTFISTVFACFICRFI
ncbi:MAG: spore maturation protein [Clostridia bacterium]|nr:spore maturation protein [Clostridia bacterium]